MPGAVVLGFRSRGSAGGRLTSLEQRVPITWTKCHLGGWRPWFRCSCGRRAAKLYDAGDQDVLRWFTLVVALLLDPAAVLLLLAATRAGPL